MGRFSRMFKRVARIAAPMVFPALAPIMALSARRSEPPASPDEVATPTASGGWLPRAVREARGRAREFVAEEVAPLLEGTPLEIVDTDDDFDDEDFDEDFDDEDFDDEEEE